MTLSEDDMADLYPDDPYTGPEVHEYLPDAAGRCTNGWWNTKMQWVDCSSTQRSSVLHHDDEADHRQKHWHGGGDCMCFEEYD